MTASSLSFPFFSAAAAASHAAKNRSALPAEEALRQLESGAGSQWDPEVVAVLVQLAKQGKVE